MTNNEFDKLLNNFFNAEWGQNVSRYQAYSPSKLALDFNGDTLELAYSVIGHDPKDVEVSLTRDKIYIKAKKNLEDKNYGATMRLGAYDAIVEKGTIAHAAYGKDKISERHRHRYEVNPEYVNF